MPGENTIEVVAQSADYTIDGEVANAATTVYGPERSTDLGFVVIQATKNNYLYSITLTAKESETVMHTYDVWDFGAEQLVSGADSLFDVAWDDTSSAAIVTLKEGESYRANGRYKVVPVFIVATPYGDVEVPAKAITIVTRQSNVKFSKLPALEARLSALTEDNTDAAVSEIMTATSPANVEIESLVQTK